MSFTKMDRSFPLKPRAISDEELAKIVAAALRQDFGETPSAIKQIGRLTGANLRAIKNWHSAKNAPSSGHLLLLARSAPTLLQFILEQIGGGDLWDAFHLLSNKSIDVIQAKNQAQNSGIYSAKLCTINSPLGSQILKNLNLRQVWFLEKVQQKENPKAEDIAEIWKISLRTAKYDIAAMIQKGMIRFVGPKKTGRYEILC